MVYKMGQTFTPGTTKKGHLPTVIINAMAEATVGNYRRHTDGKEDCHWHLTIPAKKLEGNLQTKK